jgi:NADH-quinone oxidoreductase subunit L
MIGSLHLWVIALCPLAGFAVNGLLGRKLPRAAVAAIALLATLVPALLVANIALHISRTTLPYVEKLALLHSPLTLLSRSINSRW